MTELARNADGTVKSSVRNMATASLWQYIKNWTVPSYLQAGAEATRELVAPLLYFVWVWLIIFAFPITVPIHAYIGRRNHQKQLRNIEAFEARRKK